MAGTTTNSATITNGISLPGDMTLTNIATGVVTNAGIAVYGSGANTPNTVVNAGSIGGTSAGVSLISGGAVTNQTSAEISGAVGIELSNYGGSVVNSGRATASGYGVLIQPSGFVNNQAAGAIIAGSGPDDQPVAWVGYRRVARASRPKPRAVWPIRVWQGAFAENVPARDLWLRPDHAVFEGEVLIPIKHLVNGQTIVQTEVDQVTYYHVELLRHGVLPADRLPCESYLD